MDFWTAFRDGFLRSLALENAKRTAMMQTVDPSIKTRLVQRLRDESREIAMFIVLMICWLIVFVGGLIGIVHAPF